MGIRSFFRKREKRKYGWFGDYKNWEEAKNNSTGYEAENILEKTKQSLSKVKSGEAVYERDSVLFDTKEYPFSVISCMLYTAIKNNNKLNVLDFGGSLGSTWFQVRDFIPPNLDISWSIVEQHNHVTEGKKHFEDDILKFYYTIDECIKDKKEIHLILLSGVIQCLENPHDFLNELVNYPVDHILFDRTAFINEGEDRLTIQKVPPEIFNAQYPSWFFNEGTFLNHFKSFTLKAEFSSSIEAEKTMVIDNKNAGYDKGLFFERNK
ncbi:MAG: methyltransferase, TIGR04325 family [Pedobacter sp.]|nr:MAG: methyltransferase, TIGR04325 family [Pedobacter sp.]